MFFCLRINSNCFSLSTVWPNGWVFVCDLRGCEFKSCCIHLKPQESSMISPGWLIEWLLLNEHSGCINEYNGCEFKSFCNHVNIFAESKYDWTVLTIAKVNFSNLLLLLNATYLGSSVMVITTAQLHSKKSEDRFCADANTACSFLEVAMVRTSEMVPAWNKD